MTTQVSAGLGWSQEGGAPSWSAPQLSGTYVLESFFHSFPTNICSELDWNYSSKDLNCAPVA